MPNSTAEGITGTARVPVEPDDRREPPAAPGTGDGRGLFPPVPPLPRRERRPYVAGVLVAVFVLAAGAIGAAIGYTVHGTSNTPRVPRTATSTPSTSPSPSTSAVSRVAAHVARDLVNINATLRYQTAVGAGTGMVVTSSGRVVTNNHVIAGATSIKATDLANGKTYDVAVVGYDVSEDVAVLQLQGASSLPTVTFARSSARVGDTVIAIGNAGGTGTPTAAAGVVTGLRQTITARSELSGTVEHLSGLIETNAAIQSGQSGGPLVNERGRVVGMVTAGSEDFTFSQSASQGYAVPAPTFRAIASDIVQGRGSATVHIGTTAFLGVMVAPTQGTGALVVQVLPTSPAARAGIVAGDTVVGLGGQAVLSPDTVAGVMATYDVGATVDVQVLGSTGKERTVTVTLVAGPPA